MYLHSTEYRYKHIYDAKTLKEYCDHAERDIKRALEVIEKIREYQRGLFEHYQEVINTEFKPVVKLDRRENYTSKKKEYRVSVEIRPMVEHEHINGQTVHGEFKDHKMFAGTERNDAFKYADELSKKYRCEIEKTGYWR